MKIGTKVNLTTTNLFVMPNCKFWTLRELNLTFKKAWVLSEILEYDDDTILTFGLSFRICMKIGADVNLDMASKTGVILEIIF